MDSSQEQQRRERFERYFRGNLDDAIIVASVLVQDGDGDLGTFMQEQTEFAFLRLEEMGLVRRAQETYGDH